jgi:hypothetical protein
MVGLVLCCTVVPVLLTRTRLRVFTRGIEGTGMLKTRCLTYQEIARFDRRTVFGK